jgi:hypothetical protein
MKLQKFTPELLLNLPANNEAALQTLCEEFIRFNKEAMNSPAHHDDYIEALGILRAFGDHRKIKFNKLPAISQKTEENISSIISFFVGLQHEVNASVAMRNAQVHLTAKTEEYASLFAGIPAYEFTDEEYKKLQDLISELRDLITMSKLISDDHRRRLLRRLEAMQGELHKKTSDIDRFWGFIGEAGIAVRKFGEDMKPISDRVQALGHIVIGVILAKEGIHALPEITKLLGPK